MPRIIYIAFLLIAFCRVGMVASPVLVPSSFAWVEWQDQEDQAEDGTAEKTKYESKEENWFAEIELADLNRQNAQFMNLPDSRLLEHTRKPVSPPPDIM